MYYAAKAILCLKEKYPRTHRGVLSQFGLEFVKTGAIITAQERRERADYDIYYVPSREEAESIVDDAERFLDRIKKAVDELRKQPEGVK